MPIHNLYSKRKQKEIGEIFPDVYQYEDIPQTLRNQTSLIFEHYFYNELSEISNSDELFSIAIDALKHEYGKFELFAHSNGANFRTQLLNFITYHSTNDQFLDAIEIIFTVKNNNELLHIPEGLIVEINYRFKEHGVGYQLIDGQVIRIDSELIHSEAVKPALGLLHHKGFEGPKNEFLAAYEHYRYRKNSAAIVEANKAFESTMRVICEKKGWKLEGHIAKKLLNVC